MAKLVEMVGLMAFEGEDGSRLLEIEFLVRGSQAGVEDFHVKVDVENGDDVNAAIAVARDKLHQLSLRLSETLRA